MRCDGDEQVGIFTQNGHGWEMLAGPYHRKDRQRQAMAILDIYGKTMTDDQTRRLMHLSERHPKAKPFMWVAVAQQLARGQKEFGWLR